MLDFSALEVKYGPAVAYGLLLQIERAASIKPAASAEADFETRLANALRAQDAANDRCAA